MQETQETWFWSLVQERSPAVGNGNIFHYSCGENSMERGAWLATVHETAKSWTQCLNEHNTTVVFQYFSISFYRNISLNLSGLGLILLNSQVYFYQITCKLQINFYFSESYTLLSHVQLFATSWTIQSMEFSRPEYWSG